MSDDDNEAPMESFFSKRAKLTPKKSPEELKAAAELLSKLETEKNMPIVAEAEPMSKKGRKKKVASEPAGTESDLMADLHGTRLSAAARKRLKKLKDDKEQDLALLDAKNSQILSSQTSSDIINVPAESEVPAENVINLTVTYLSKIARFKCHENEKFVKVFQDVADFFKLKPTEFLLCLKERNIAVSDTPKSLSLTELDILECIPYKVDETSETLSDDENSLKISFQSNDMKNKIDLIVSKMERMQSIMERYSKERNLPLNELEFQFDGEKLTGDETPGELDMESENCIDVTVFAPVAQCSTSNDSPVAGCSYANDSMLAAGCSYVSDEDMPAYLQNFVFVDSDSNGSDIVMLD